MNRKGESSTTLGTILIGIPLLLLITWGLYSLIENVVVLLVASFLIGGALFLFSRTLGLIALAILITISSFSFGTWLIGVVILSVTLLVWARANHDIRFYLFWLVWALSAHIYIFLADFNLYTIFVVAAALFVPLIFYLIPAFQYSENPQQALEAFVAYLAALGFYAVPYLTERYLFDIITNVFKFANNWPIIDIATGIVALVPLFPIFILLRERHRGDSNATGILQVYAFVVIGYIVLVPFLSLILSLPAVIDRVAPGSLSGEVDARSNFDAFIERINSLWKKDIGQRVKRLEQQAKDPNEFYPCHVEDSEEKIPPGVHITDLRLVDNDVDNETQIILYGNIHAEAHLGPSISVTPSCIIAKRGIPPATVDPPQLNVVFGTSGTFTCTFLPIPKRGTYVIDVGVTFPFQTESRVPFTFVHKRDAENFAAQGINIRSHLDIDQHPAAEYSGGPVRFCMTGSNQPILVDPDDDPILPPGTSLGFTLEEDWNGGEIEQVYEIDFHVRDPFDINEGGCDREITAIRPNPTDPDVTEYIMENIAPTTVATYLSSTCKPTIPTARAEAARDLVRDPKQELTFRAFAHYEYTIKDKATVRVR